MKAMGYTAFIHVEVEIYPLYNVNKDSLFNKYIK